MVLLFFYRYKVVKNNGYDDFINCNSFIEDYIGNKIKE